jgi:hypothetical protein
MTVTEELPMARAKAIDFDVFLPLRLEDWDNDKTLLETESSGRTAAALEIPVPDDTELYAIEDGSVTIREDGRGFNLSSRNGNRIWMYMSDPDEIEFDFAEGSEVNAGEPIGAASGVFRLAVKDDKSPSVAGELDGARMQVVFGRDPLPLLNSLGVEALPIDKEEGLVTVDSDESSELTAMGFGKPDKMLRYAAYAGAGILGAAILYKILWK